MKLECHQAAPPKPLSLPFVNMVLVSGLSHCALTPLPCIGRCASPVAMEPQLDISAAFVCAFCFSPVVLGLHWGTEWNEARDRCTSAQKRFEMERLRLMCGEGEAHAHGAPLQDRLGSGSRRRMLLCTPPLPTEQAA